jgi:uncharacterized protein
MKIHLKQISAEGLHVEGEEECPIAEVIGQEVRCAGPLRYSLDVGLSGDALWANGTLSQPVEVNCVACLEPFVHTIEVNPFALHTELTGPEIVDLTPMMLEDILLNLPAYPRCDRDAGRTCAAATAEASDELAEAERKREAAWSALDRLKL